MNGIPNILFHIFISGDNIIHKLTKQQSLIRNYELGIESFKFQISSNS